MSKQMLKMAAWAAVLAVADPVCMWCFGQLIAANIASYDRYGRMITLVSTGLLVCSAAVLAISMGMTCGRLVRHMRWQYRYERGGK